MILIALAWILISIAFLGLGKLIAAGFCPPGAKEDFSETGYLFMGLSLAGLLSAFWWVFAPVGPIFGGFLLGTGIGYAFASLPLRLEISFKNRWFLFAAILFFLGLLMKAAAPTSYYDCGLYYVQTVRWIQQYPAVPGLANLHIRFGNASAWHMLGAAFDWKSIFHGAFDDLGELMLFWFILFHSWNVLKLEGFERYLSLGLIIFSIWQSQILLAAPTPDLAAGILGMQTLWQFRKFLRLWNPREPHQLNTRGLALFIQSLYLAQIKLSAIPFLIIAVVVVFLVLREGWIFRAGQLVFMCLLVAFSMVARSYLLSGYLLFPVFQGGFEPDWLVARGEVIEYLDGVRGFARHTLTLHDIHTGRKYEEFGRLSFGEWFPLWASERRWTDWLCMLSGVFGWLLLVRYASLNLRKSFLSNWPLIFFTWLSGMMLLFWFSNAPDVRFGMAILGTGFSYTFGSLCLWLAPTFDFLMQRLPRHWALVILSGWTIWLCKDLRALKEFPIFPPGYHKIEMATYLSADGKIMYTPDANQTNPYVDSEQCWDGPLPCSLNAIQWIEFRGKDLREGFRVRSGGKAK